ncbi:Uncharacterised protein [Raoultella terrigena]|jgi:hypothetical protein|uniref:Uncharacterized protein n=2 Tax=Raoultella terrigena TaxID=577 RepID=A0A4U9CXW4_RAOTE|nr:Uncharacterised protein [Raoultella terrigena]VUC83899.1 oxidoreductase [Raoultella terrigena]
MLKSTLICWGLLSGAPLTQSRHRARMSKFHLHEAQAQLAIVASERLGRERKILLDFSSPCGAVGGVSADKAEDVPPGDLISAQSWLT